MKNLSSGSTQTLDKELFTSFHKVEYPFSLIWPKIILNVAEILMLLFTTYIYCTDFHNTSCKGKQRVLPPDLCAPQLFVTVLLMR